MGLRPSQVSALAGKDNRSVFIISVNTSTWTKTRPSLGISGRRPDDRRMSWSRRTNATVYWHHTDLFDVSTAKPGWSPIPLVDSALASVVSSVNADTLPLAVFDTGHNEMMDTTLYKNLLTSNNF